LLRNGRDRNSLGLLETHRAKKLNYSQKRVTIREGGAGIAISRRRSS
jgi:hypothetical protein